MSQPGRAGAVARGAIAALAIHVGCAAAAAAAAQFQYSGGYTPSPIQAEGVPKELRKATIDETKLGAQIPLSLTFNDESGKPVTLREILRPDRPAILQLGYMRCPMLCNLMLNKLVTGLKSVEWSAGSDFDIISVSINPEENSDLAAAKKLGYVVEYGRAGSEGGWHFLTGPAENSQALADAVGFGFEKQPNGEYAHAACLFVITPDGHVSRQLYGAEQKPSTLRLALVEASHGTIGTIVDRFILWCHTYDPGQNSYSLRAYRVMQIGGAITVLAVGIGVIWLRIAYSRPGKQLAPPASDSST